MKRKVGGVGQNLEFFGCLKLKKFVKPWIRRLCWLYSCNHLFHILKVMCYHFICGYLVVLECMLFIISSFEYFILFKKVHEWAKTKT